MTYYVTLLLSSMDSTCFLVNSNIWLILQTCTLHSLINTLGKANATLCASHVFVTLEAIIHDSSVSDGAIPASDQFGGSEADMPGYNCSAQCFEAWYAAHPTTCITQSSKLYVTMTYSRYWKTQFC